MSVDRRGIGDRWRCTVPIDGTIPAMTPPNHAFAAKTVIPGSDFHRMMPPDGATKLKCSGGGGKFGDAIIKHMGPGAGDTQTEHKPVPQMARA